MPATSVPAQFSGDASAAAAGPPAPRRRFRPLRLLALLALALLLVIAGTVAWIAWGLPRIELDRPVTGRPSLTLEAADGTPISQSGGTYLGPVKREELPEHLVEAVLAIEDRRFFDHMGLDPIGIVRAAWRNYQAGGIVQGGSTITQQLAKVLFLTPDQTFRRKLQEAVIASWLDVRFSKDEILTKYVDSVYFGAGATGITAAAEVYFDKPVSELTLAESAMLAALIRAPSRLNPRTNLKGARERTTIVLDAMVKAGFISQDQAIEAALNPATPVRSSELAQTGSWFGDWIYAEASAAMGPLLGAARIRTTLQPPLQGIAERVVRHALAESGAELNASQAALVAMRPDGAVLAMVGGRSYQASQFNRAVDALRQPGSAFKTFVYLAALRAGRSPDSTIVDKPVQIGKWRPENFSGRYYGEVTLKQAFAQSLNAATVRLAQEVGIESVIETARDLGIDADLKPNMTLALGTAEVSLLDLTGAYASIAAGQGPVQPWGIAGLATSVDAEPAMFTPAAPTVPLSGRDEIVEMLRAVVEDGTGQRAALDELAAGKTGTSQNYRDAWFVGFTDDLVVGVWVGNDDNSPMKGVTGGRLPAEIWRDFVAQARGSPAEEEFPDEPLPEDVPVAAAPDAEVVEQAPEPVVVEMGAAGEAMEPESEPLEIPEEELAADMPAPQSRSDPAPQVVERRAAEPQQEAAPERRRAREAKRPRARQAERPARTGRARREREQPAERARRRSEEPGAIERRLAERRRAAEEYAARRRAGAERRADDDGPSILLGGRGLP